MEMEQGNDELMAVQFHADTHARGRGRGRGGRGRRESRGSGRGAARRARGPTIPGSESHRLAEHDPNQAGTIEQEVIAQEEADWVDVSEAVDGEEAVAAVVANEQVQATRHAPKKPGRSRTRKPQRNACAEEAKEDDVEGTKAKSLVDRIACKLQRENVVDRADFTDVDGRVCNVNGRTTTGDTLLVEACRYGRIETVAVLLETYKADVNVASHNTMMGRKGMLPVHAACLALQIELVEMLLSATEQVVDVTKLYGFALPAMICMLYCVGNGYSSEQERKGVEILRRILAYAQTHDQLNQVLTFQTHGGDQILHVAIRMSNYAALEVLTEFGVDVTTPTSTGSTFMQMVEDNVYGRRSFTTRVLPMQQVKKTTQTRNRKRKSKKEQVETSDVVEQEPESIADHELGSNTNIKMLDREIENAYLLKTMLVLINVIGEGPIFMLTGPHAAHSIHLKGLILANKGVFHLVESLAALPEDTKDKRAYIDGVVHCVTNLYTNNSSRLTSIWKKATAFPREEASALSAVAFHSILDSVVSNSTSAMRARVWMLLLAEWIRVYSKRGEHAEFPAYCSASDWYEKVAKAIYRSGCKILFAISDRSTPDERQYDHEHPEVDLFVALTELFLSFFIPFARRIQGSSISASMHVAEKFQHLVAPIKKLWPLMEEALSNMDGTVSAPHRFSRIIHVLSIFEQVEFALTQNEKQALSNLRTILQQYTKQEATKRRTPYDSPKKKLMLLHRIYDAFTDVAPSYIDRVRPLRDKIELLVRTDYEVVGLDLRGMCRVDTLIKLDYKLEYLEIMSEDHSSSVAVSISRASNGNAIDFIIQQIASASPYNLKGELDITLVNEPGIGIGVTREFFLLIRQSFFNPQGAKSKEDATLSTDSLPQVSAIGSQWLQMARSQNASGETTAASSAAPILARKNRKAKGKASRTVHSDIFRFFPLFEYTSANSDVFRISHRRLRVTESNYAKYQAQEDGPLLRKHVLSHENEADLKQLYRCVGRLLGLAIRYGQPLGAHFPLALWKFFQNDDVDWSEYCHSDPVFQSSLQSILDHDFDMDPWELRFEYTTEVDVVLPATASSSSVSKAKTTTVDIELFGHRSFESVTNVNKLQYVMARAQLFFFGEELVYYREMRSGVLDTMDKSDFKLLLPAELQRIACGERVIDLKKLQDVVVYKKSGSKEHATIKMFWDVVNTFDEQQKQQLLTFWSGTAMPPLFGFQGQDQWRHGSCWYIELESNKSRANLCPTANTCDRRLMLPLYPSTDMLREKLMIALEHGSIGYDRL